MAAEPVVRLEAVSKRYPGGTVAVDAVDLAVAPGEFLTLLGPSGCGKTTTLRLIGGFERPSGGRVAIDGADMTEAPPYARPVNTMFQDYALFPHMDVAENVGFGLSVRRVPAPERRRRVAAALELVGLADRAASRVTALSGGQRQRVALARALVNEPRVLLLDEPLAALDAHLREQMQVELKRLQGRLGTTFILVTHDQTEALSISDRIAVMNRGRVEQVAPPATLYDAPGTRFVAGFIGAMNLLAGRVVGRQDGALLVEAGGLRLTAPAARQGPEPGAAVTVALRPEDLRLTDGEPDAVACRVEGTAFHGRSLRLHLTLPSGAALMADLPRAGLRGTAFPPGTPVRLTAAGAPIRLYPAD